MTDDDGPTPMIQVTAGSPDHESVQQLVEYIRTVLAPLVHAAEDKLHLQALLMTACSVFAGTIYGSLIVAGLAKEQEKRRAGEMMLKNFRSGIDVDRSAGLRAAMLMADEEGAGHA